MIRLPFRPFAGLADTLNVTEPWTRRAATLWACVDVGALSLPAPGPRHRCYFAWHREFCWPFSFYTHRSPLDVKFCSTFHFRCCCTLHSCTPWPAWTFTLRRVDLVPPAHTVFLSRFVLFCLIDIYAPGCFVPPARQVHRVILSLGFCFSCSGASQTEKGLM